MKKKIPFFPRCMYNITDVRNNTACCLLFISLSLSLSRSLLLVFPADKTQHPCTPAGAVAALDDSGALEHNHTTIIIIIIIIITTTSIIMSASTDLAAAVDLEPPGWPPLRQIRLELRARARQGRRWRLGLLGRG